VIVCVLCVLCVECVCCVNGCVCEWVCVSGCVCVCVCCVCCVVYMLYVLCVSECNNVKLLNSMSPCQVMQLDVGTSTHCKFPTTAVPASAKYKIIII